jgi:hypothetical protein
MHLDRADFKPIESEIDVPIRFRVSVEHADSNALVVGSDHGDCINVCRLQARMLDPDGVGRSRASTISIAITPAGKLNAHYRSGQLGRFRRWPSRMKLEKSLSLVVSLVFPTQTI